MSEVHTPADEASGPPTPQDRLAATLASRICHDLTSPLGAIANGVELLLLSGVVPSPELALIAESVESANARIQFFRLAYGTAGRESVGRGEVVRTLDALARGSRLGYEWNVDGEHPREEVKAVCLLLQCLETALPMGGRLQVARQGGSWRVIAEGPRLRTELPAWQILAGSASPLSAGSAVVQFTLLAGALAALDRVLVLDEAPDRIEARF